MKLEFKYITPYLPYQLKCKDETGKIGILSGIGFNGDPIDFMSYTISYDWEVKPDSSSWNVYNDGNTISRIKPILHPLSDMFNIPEIMDEFSEYHLEAFKDAFMVLGRAENCFDFINYTQIQLMFKHHIDLFGLLENNLAIDINTIKS